MFKTLLTAATAALVATPAVAAPATGTFADHQNLWETLQGAGIQTLINPTTCEPDLAGFYWIPDGVNPQLVICQENGKAGGPEVAWTEWDLDTLRHESQHAIQDCIDGKQDMELDLYMDTPWALEVLGTARGQRIATTYIENGATPSVVLAEYEAFAVAEVVPANMIADGVKSVCHFKF